jgi:hypothetical protein
MDTIVKELLQRDATNGNKTNQIVGALNHLTRALTLEVLTRPDVVKRASDEAQQIQDSVSSGIHTSQQHR